MRTQNNNTAFCLSITIYGEKITQFANTHTHGHEQWASGSGNLIVGAQTVYGPF